MRNALTQVDISRHTAIQKKDVYKSLPLNAVVCWLGEDLQEQLLRAFEVAATSGKEDPLQLRLIEKKAEETWMSAYRKP